MTVQQHSFDSFPSTVPLAEKVPGCPLPHDAPERTGEAGMDLWHRPGRAEHHRLRRLRPVFRLSELLHGAGFHPGSGPSYPYQPVGEPARSGPGETVLGRTLYQDRTVSALHPRGSVCRRCGGLCRPSLSVHPDGVTRLRQPVCVFQVVHHLGAAF